MKEIVKEFFRMIGKLLSNKYLLIGVIAVVVGGGLKMRSCQINSHNEAMQTYQRQVSGQLNEKEQELQKLRTDLGVSKSELITQSDLADRIKNDKEEVDKNFNEFVKEHNLNIRSRDRTIARLQGVIKGGSSETVVIPVNPGDKDVCSQINKCVVSYFWEDDLQRFQLEDPNIFEKGNETFKNNQIFKIYGEIWEQEDGSLQTRRLVLREMFKDTDGEYKPIEDAKAEILDSEFEYHNPPTVETEWEWTDLFRLRAIAVGGIEILPNSGNVTFGLGVEFMTFYGFGLGSYTSLDFQDPENIAQHISLQYNPTIFDTELNFGAFVSVGTPFVRAFNAYQFNAGLVFYLNN